MAQTYIPGAGEFFDRLNGAGLPEETRARIGETLTMLLEDDGDTIAPKFASFSAFLSFLAQHLDRAAPSIGVNCDGLVTAVWQEPQFRLSLEFPPAGKIHWLMTEWSGGAPFVRDGWDNPNRVPLPPRQQHAFA